MVVVGHGNKGPTLVQRPGSEPGSVLGGTIGGWYDQWGMGGIGWRYAPEQFYNTPQGGLTPLGGDLGGGGKTEYWSPGMERPATPYKGTDPDATQR